MARARRVVDDIPAELMKHAFAHLDFYSLLYAAHVSQRWRDLAIEHPMFWKYVGVTSASRGTLDCLEARLGQGRGRPFDLEIDISGMHPLIIPKLLRHPLPAIMHCVQQLRITLDANYILDLFPLLNMRAPELVEFHLHLLSPDRQLPLFLVSPWIFGKEPGKLRALSIVDVIFPLDNIPAFANVDYLKLEYPSNCVQEFPHHLIEHCMPRLRHVYLCVGYIKFTTTFSPAALRIISQFDFLDINFNPFSTTAFVQSMPRLSEIPNAVLSGRIDFDAMYDFLGPLRSPFNFAILRTGITRLRICIQDVSTGFTRAVSDEVAVYARGPCDNDDANVLFDNEEFAGQITTLTLSTSLWSSMKKFLTRYTTIGTLIVEFDWLTPIPLDAQPLPADTIHWPGLRTLVLQSRYDVVYVTPDQVLAFAERLDAPLPVDLELRGVLVVGGTDALKGSFETVTSTRQLRWPSLPCVKNQREASAQ